MPLNGLPYHLQKVARYERAVLVGKLQKIILIWFSTLKERGPSWNENVSWLRSCKPNRYEKIEIWAFLSAEGASKRHVMWMLPCFRFGPTNIVGKETLLGPYEPYYCVTPSMNSLKGMSSTVQNYYTETGHIIHIESGCPNTSSHLNQNHSAYGAAQRMSNNFHFPNLGFLITAWWKH